MWHRVVTIQFQKPHVDSGSQTELDVSFELNHADVVHFVCSDGFTIAPATLALPAKTQTKSVPVVVTRTTATATLCTVWASATGQVKPLPSHNVAVT